MTARHELNDFFEYCKRTNIELLKEDIIFISDCCSPYRYADVRKILHKYVNEWRDVYDKCDIIYRKSNAARKAANSFLLANVHSS